MWSGLYNMVFGGPYIPRPTMPSRSLPANRYGVIVARNRSRVTIKFVSAGEMHIGT